MCDFAEADRDPRDQPPSPKVRWGRLGEHDRHLDHQNVTPRRDGQTHGSPKFRRRSLAQDLTEAGNKRLTQIGSQLGLGQPCKVHLKVHFVTSGVLFTVALQLPR